jgi:hypothetical protein
LRSPFQELGSGACSVKSSASERKVRNTWVFECHLTKLDNVEKLNTKSLRTKIQEEDLREKKIERHPNQSEGKFLFSLKT